MIVVLLALGTGLAMAKGRGPGKPCERIEGLQQWMKDSLSLSSDQQGKIKTINDSACARIQRARQASGGDREAAKTAVQGIMKDTRKAYEGVLTPDQQNKLKAHMKAGKKHEKKELTPAQRADKMTAKMTTDLSLTEAQIPQVKAANLELATRMEAMKQRKSSGAGKDELKGLAQSIRKEYDAKITAVLTASQKATWDKLKAERKAAHKGHGGPPKK